MMPLSDARIQRRGLILLAAAAVIFLGANLPASATPSAARDALREVRAYIAAHNRHDLTGVMAFYAEDATFVLNGGRPPVEGRSKISELEAFDVAAGSQLHPLGLQARVEGDGVVVSLQRVVEKSRLFSAAGLDTVSSQPLARAFVVRHGKFVLVAEPEFKPACREVMVQALSGTMTWLKSTSDVRKSVLAPQAKLELTTPNVAVLVGAFRDWRSVSGWKPDERQVKLCAG